MLRLICGMGLCLGWTTAVAAQERLSLEQALQLALRNNPRITAARQRVAAAQGRVDSARSHPNPELQLIPAGKIDDAQLVLFQPTELLSGRRTLRHRAARAEAAAAEADLHAEMLALTFDVTTAYVAWQEAVKVQQLTEKSVALARRLHETAQKQFDAGDVPRAHVIRTRIELASAEQELTAARAMTDMRRAALNTLLARAPHTLAAPADDLTYTPREVDVSDLIGIALAQRPEIQAAQFNAQSGEFIVQFARAQRRPDLLFEWRSVRLTRHEGRAVGVGLSFPLLDFGRIRGEVRAAAAEAAARRALLVQVQQTVALEVEAALRRLRAAREQVEIYTKRISPDVEELMKMMQAGYPEGVTLLEVIDAQRTLTTTGIQFVRAVAEHQRALTELERAIGGTLPASDAARR
ncbi:MAG: TolC family protein [Abditibacteriales bacterium]|nr:TolC family protein [Abditibacteriales bacterium]MDW8364905.1 TolC family protein [Abditibacteriales bacterium]